MISDQLRVTPKMFLFIPLKTTGTVVFALLFVLMVNAKKAYLTSGWNSLSIMTCRYFWKAPQNSEHLNKWFCLIRLHEAKKNKEWVKFWYKEHRSTSFSQFWSERLTISGSWLNDKLIFSRVHHYNMVKMQMWSRQRRDTSGRATQQQQTLQQQSPVWKESLFGYWTFYG